MRLGCFFVWINVDYFVRLVESILLFDWRVSLLMMTLSPPSSLSFSFLSSLFFSYILLLLALSMLSKDFDLISLSIVYNRTAWCGVVGWSVSPFCRCRRGPRPRRDIKQRLIQSSTVRHVELWRQGTLGDRFDGFDNIMLYYTHKAK